MFFFLIDAELKNIIDKLANFVARNGPEFEHMTKQKQQDNPKFSFLFGGENYSYYQYKVQTEQASKFLFFISPLKCQSRLQQMTFINIFSEKIRLDVSSESSARQRIHLKINPYFVLTSHHWPYFPRR